jgi:hypothetical protein
MHPGKSSNLLKARTLAAGAPTIACALALLFALRAVGQNSSGVPSIPAAPVAQFNGNKMTMPNKRPLSRTSGLSITVDPRWSSNYGYRPIEVTVISPKAATADHVITIELHAGWRKIISVEQRLRLDKGSTSATATIAMPMYQTQNANNFWWDVWVDGVRDKDLTVDQNASLNWSGGTPSTASLTFLVLGSANRDRSLVATNGSELAVLTVSRSQLPVRWIDYTALDVVALSLSEAQQIARQQPAAFEAIKLWVQAGGQLWISDVGKELEQLPALSKLMSLAAKMDTGQPEEPPEAEEPSKTSEAKEGATNEAAKASSNEKAPNNHDEKSTEGKDESTSADKSQTLADKKSLEDKPTTDAQPTPKGWRPLHFRRGIPEGQVVTFLDTRMGTRRTIRDPEVIQRMRNDPNFVTTEERFEASSTVSDRKFITDSSDWFVEQNAGLGTVRAFRGGNEVAKFAVSPPTSNPNAVANSEQPDELSKALAIGLRRTERWDMRHGMTPEGNNAEFAKFLVPGVGLAPVTEFEVLITLFVLLIGPVNYWLLRRYKKLHLMVLTVPLAAIITTVALFGYAIISDGFSTRVRAQSFTALDQTTGEASCWTRLSYYSGLAPGGGLSMPADVVVYPILASWARDSLIYDEKQMVWTGDGAQLKQGWLISRTPTQYLSIRARKTPLNLQVLSAANRMRVKNGLGTNIKSLVVINDDGKMFFGEDIVTSESVNLRPIASDDAIRNISKLIVDAMPQAPEALASGDADLATVLGAPRSRRYGRYGNQYSSGRLSENLATDAITGLAGLNGSPALALPPRSYVAITNFGPEVEFGIDGAREEASFHIIQGKY